LLYFQVGFKKTSDFSDVSPCFSDVLKTCNPFKNNVLKKKIRFFRRFRRFYKKKI